MAAHLTLVRHAHTSANNSGLGAVMSGWTDVPLSGEGERQLGRLNEHLLDRAPFEAIYSSPLQRAQQTALSASRVCGAPVQLLADLKEINCGTLEGLPIDLVRRNFPLLWEENLRQQNAHFRWPEGESYADFRTRSVAAMNRIAALHPGQRVLVITHCGVISQIAGHICGLNPAAWNSFRVENTSISEVLWNAAGSAILSFNDCRHLQARRQFVPFCSAAA